jgi:predicted HD superfamily hydrolase involved in NAD metabolism
MAGDIAGITGERPVEILRELLSPERFSHSLGTASTCAALAKKYRAGVKTAALAGLLHDCAKDLSTAEEARYIRKYSVKMDPVSKKIKPLWHCFLGPFVAMEKFGVRDKKILDAIANHTAGKPGMDVISKIVYVADFSEEGRIYGASMAARKRIFSKISLDELTLFVLKEKLKYLIDQGKLIHNNSILLWNSLNA